MGRARNTSHAAIAAAVQMRGSRGRVAQVAHSLSTGEGARLLARYQRRLKNVDLDGITDPETRDRLRAQAVGHMTDAEQRLLISTIREAQEELDQAGGRTGPQAKAVLQQLIDEGKDMFVLSNNGIVHQWVTRQFGSYVGQMEERDFSRRRQIAYQHARGAMLDAIRRFKLDHEVSVMSYTSVVVRTALNDMLETERGHTNFKSRKNDQAGRVNTAINAIRRERGSEATINAAEVAERANVDVEHAVQMLPHLVDRSLVRLDAPVRGFSAEDAWGYELRDRLGEARGEPREQSTEDTVMHDDRAAAVKDVLDGINSPFKRRLLELQFGLAGEPVEQRLLYQGIYRDADGNAYTAEGTVEKAWADAGESAPLMREKQSELNRRYQAGEVKWEPMNEHARALGQLYAMHKDMEDVAGEAGLPLTSGLVQNELEKVTAELRTHARLREHRPQYRGPNALENSEKAREVVRRALTIVGAVDIDAADKLKTGRVSQASGRGEGPLRQLAEARGFVNEDGSLNAGAIKAAVAVARTHGRAPGRKLPSPVA